MIFDIAFCMCTYASGTFKYQNKLSRHKTTKIGTCFTNFRYIICPEGRFAGLRCVLTTVNKEDNPGKLPVQIFFQ